MISDILNIIAVVLAAGVIIVILINYARDRKKPEWQTMTRFCKFIYVARDSFVWFSGYATIIASAILTNLDSLATAIGQPQIKQILDQYFEPKVVGYVLLAASLWFMYARARTLTKPTV